MYKFVISEISRVEQVPGDESSFYYNCPSLFSSISTLKYIQLMPS
jgi:hypothetical protein